jgi:hypothetical protein
LQEAILKILCVSKNRRNVIKIRTKYPHNYRHENGQEEAYDKTEVVHGALHPLLTHGAHLHPIYIHKQQVFNIHNPGRADTPRFVHARLTFGE